jgi:glycosyltransferase involved in cell wall biosynthesis
VDLRAVGDATTSGLTVVQMLPALEGGGVERGALEVAAALAQRGHRSLVISAGGPHVVRLEAGGSRHIAWPIGTKSPLTLRWVGRVRRLLARENVDILHARSRLPAWVAWLAWRGLPPARRPRFLTTVHGLYSVSAYSAIMMKGERIIAVSEAARDYIRTNYPGVAPRRIAVIPRGVAPTEYPAGYSPDEIWLADWYRQYPATRGKYLVTLPGRLTRRKGMRDFIAVVQGLKQAGIPVHGLAVGGFPASPRARFKQECRRRLALAGLEDTITLTGYREDLREILAISGAVLSLAHQPEAFGRTVAEALSLGRPVAGYAHGGVGEQLTTLFPAGAVAVGDAAGIRNRLLEWYPAAPTPAVNHLYTLERMLDSTLDLYREMAGDRHNAAPGTLRRG